MKVSLVATVKDAAPHIGEFLASVAAQSRAPDEVVVVDGGSVDGTREILEASGAVTLIDEPGANIARGRNVAVKAAAHDVLAVTDADCVLDPPWLERLLEPLDAGADVSMGFYRPLGSSLLQVCAGAVVPDPEEVREDRFMPSARSVAFVRDAYLAAGGYPEWLDVGEDMYLNHQWREIGVRMSLAREAVVSWRIRPSLAETWRQYVAYARGDALARMYARRHALRFSVYAGAAGVLASRRAVPIGLATVGGIAYAGRPALRAARRAGGGVRGLAAAALTPPTLAFIDLAKMAGYAQGLIAPLRTR